MRKIDDGGAVIDLRDYFAAHADVSAYTPIETFERANGCKPTILELAKYIANIRMIEADAMLAAREAGKTEHPVREVLSDDLSKCQRALMEAGKPYPKTCPVCGLGGKCKRDQQPGAGGWIEWNGGECPVPEGISFFIKFRDGDECAADDGAGLVWVHEGHAGDIIAYRIVSNGDQK